MSSSSSCQCGSSCGGRCDHTAEKLRESRLYGEAARALRGIGKFCQEGVNKGKPGPCPGPQHDRDAGGSTATARAPAAARAPAGAQGSAPGGARPRPRPAAPSPHDLAAAPKTSLSGLDVQKVTVGGRDFVIKSKVRDSNAKSKQGAEVEQRVSELAGMAGVNVPASWSMQVKGNESTVTEFVRGQSLDKMSSADRRRALARVPAEQVSRQILFDYAVGFHDNHTGNFIVDDRGNLVGIDKEFSLSRGGSPGAQWRIPEIAHDLPGAEPSYRDVPLSQAEVTHMAGAAGRMAEALKAAGKGGEAAYVARRAAVLGKLGEVAKPTFGDLERLSDAAHRAAGGSPLSGVRGVAGRVWARIRQAFAGGTSNHAEGISAWLASGGRRQGSAAAEARQGRGTMRVRFGFDGETTGEVESYPDGTLAVVRGDAGRIDRLLKFHLENFVDGGGGTERSTADDLLRYVVGRMQGKRSWAKEVAAERGRR